MIRKLEAVSKAVASLFCGVFLLLPAGCHGLASDSHPASVAEKPGEVDAARAYEHVKRLVEFGPHPSGSEAIKKAQSYIKNELTSLGLKVSEDNFTAETP